MQEQPATIPVVLNTCYGGFGLSDKGKELYKIYSNKDKPLDEYGISRHNPNLVRVVQELGTESYGRYAKLEIENIPIEFKDCYEITEYDGTERIDLSPCLLIDHKLKELDIEPMSLEDCRETLLELKKISSTNYYK